MEPYEPYLCQFCGSRVTCELRASMMKFRAAVLISCKEFLSPEPKEVKSGVDKAFVRER